MYLYLRDGKFLTAKLAKAGIEERTKIPITSAKFCKNYSKFGYGYRIQVQELGKSYRIKPEHISEVISSSQFQNLLKSSHEFKLCQISFIKSEKLGSECNAIPSHFMFSVLGINIETKERRIIAIEERFDEIRMMGNPKIRQMGFWKDGSFFIVGKFTYPDIFNTFYITNNE